MELVPVVAGIPGVGVPAVGEQTGVGERFDEVANVAVGGECRRREFSVEVRSGDDRGHPIGTLRIGLKCLVCDVERRAHRNITIQAHRMEPGSLA